MQGKFTTCKAVLTGVLATNSYWTTSKDEALAPDIKQVGSVNSNDIQCAYLKKCLKSRL